MKTMTKGLSLILCLAMLVAGNLSPALGEADDEETKTAVFQTSAEGSDCVFSYRLDEDGATITKAVWPNIFQPPEQLIIPSQVDGHPVIAIGADAFFPEDIHSVFREAMDYVNGPSTNVRLPGTLLRIEEDAFSGAPVSCVYIPKSVTEIQGNPFAFTVDEIIVEEGSPAFEMINGTLMDKRTQTLVAGLGGYFDKDDNYYDYAYDYDFDYDDYDNYDWKYLIPQGTVTIGPEALSYCSWETQPPVIPDTVTTIGYMAFAECSWWDQELVIPASVTHIEDFAFYGGYDLTRVSLPASLEFMGDNPFMYCGLESVTLHGPGDGLRLVDGALYDQRVKALVVLPSNAETVEFAIPEGTLRIDSGAFYNRKQLETVFIPDSVTSIGKAAFSDCSSLKTIRIPDGITAIGKAAFSDCLSLKTIRIPDGITTIEDRTFSSSGLAELILPESVTTIGDLAFFRCNQLTKIGLPAGLMHIGKWAFEYCTRLSSIKIPKGIEELGGGAFAGCRSLMAFEIAGEHPRYETVDGILFDKQEKSLLFYPCAKQGTEYTVPMGTLAIGQGAFESNQNLQQIHLPQGLLKLGSSSFSSCQELREITVPGSVMESNGVSNCPKLEKAVLEEGVVTLGWYMFSNCPSLTEEGLALPSTLKSICYSGLSNCTGLTKLVIPEGVERIEASAFGGCENLREVTMPANLTSIGSVAFYGCKSLQELNFPANLTVIGEGAFAYCQSLRELNFPANLTFIGERAFADCQSLKKVDFPDGLTLIGWAAFADCQSLKEVTLPASLTFIEEGAFGIYDDSIYYPDITFTAPAGSYAANYLEKMGFAVHKTE